MISFTDLSVADHRRSAQGRVHFINALVEKLKTEGEQKGEDELDKRLGVVKELVVSRFIVEINKFPRI